MLTEFPIQRILDHLARELSTSCPSPEPGSRSSRSRPVLTMGGIGQHGLDVREAANRARRGPCVAAYRTGKAVAMPISREARFPLFVARALEAGLGAVFTFPLCQGDMRLGALDLYRGTPGPLSDEEMVAAQTLADVASAYLVNAQARSDLLDASAQATAVSLHDAVDRAPEPHSSRRTDRARPPRPPPVGEDRGRSLHRPRWVQESQRRFWP